MARNKEKPTILFVKRRGVPVPATENDAEEFDRLAEGSTVKLEPGTERGHDQLAFYWLVLSAVVKATGRWPNKEKLHDAVKWDLGYVTVSHNLRGMPRLVLDSIGLSDMSDADRSVFMEQAFARIAEVIGTDPVSLLPRREAA